MFQKSFVRGFRDGDSQGFYFDKLIKRKNNVLIKVITGTTNNIVKYLTLNICGYIIVSIEY